MGVILNGHVIVYVISEDTLRDQRKKRSDYTVEACNFVHSNLKGLFKNSVTT